ncbi:MAG: DUF2254 domain-containing protein [Hyphomicrobiales bacterium]
MNWQRRYQLRSYLRSSSWFVPFLALLLEQVVFRAALWVESSAVWVPVWPMDLAGTQATLQSIITFTLSFIVFTFGSILVAIQVAGGQLTSRVIATALLRDNTIRFSVGLMVFTLLFAIGTVGRSSGDVRHLLVWICALLGIASIADFLYLIDYAARLLRPVSIVARVADDGLAVIDTVYPEAIVAEDPRGAKAPAVHRPGRVVRHQGTSAVVLAIDIQSLIATAQRLDSVLEIVPRIGDFIADGEPLIIIHGQPEEVDEEGLRNLVATGPERTIEQDSTFAFRVIVDIAIRALSKAINDPTTAVVSIDQLQRMLQRVGTRNLHDERIFDRGGIVRVLLPTPNWEDFVELSCREIRLYGAENFQVARRLRAMIQTLKAVLPKARKPALDLELRLLDAAIAKSYPLPEDAALARIADTQGLGGASS